MRIRRTMSAAIFLTVSTAAMACPGQTGKVIFSDDFSDDSGGWDTNANASYIKGAYQIKADPKTDSDSIYNLTFNAVEGDYCIEVMFPSDPPDAGNADDFGILFLSRGFDSHYAFSINTDGEAWGNRSAKGNRSQPFPPFKVPAIKTAPGSVNSIRVVVKEQRMTFFVNAEQVKTLRAQLDENANTFGFWAGANNGAPAKERLYLVKSFTVTEAP